MAVRMATAIVCLAMVSTVGIGWGDVLRDGGTDGYPVLSETPGTCVSSTDAYVVAVGLSYLFGGDLNHDGYVNVGDLQLMVAAWGSRKIPPSSNWNIDADLNGDGFVNVADLQLLIAHWGAGH